MKLKISSQEHIPIITKTITITITQIIIYLLNLIQINIGFDTQNSILVSFLAVIVPTAFIVVLFKLKPYHLLLSIPAWCIMLLLFFVPGHYLTVRAPAVTDIAFTSFADSLIYRFFAVIEIVALQLLIALLVMLVKRIAIRCTKIDRYQFLKYTLLPILIWVTIVVYMNIVNTLIAPLISHLLYVVLNIESSEIRAVTWATAFVMHTICQVLIVCIITSRMTRKFNLKVKSLLAIIPITYLCFALYAPQGFYMLVYTGRWSFFFTTYPEMLYWYASIFITIQYGIVMLCALSAVRAAMYSDKVTGKRPSDPISEILYCSWKRENILKENLSVARYNRYLDRMTRCAKILKDEKRLDELLPYLKDENISIRFDIATLLFSHYKNECTEVLSEIAKMTEEKGLPKHLASLPENAEKLASNDFFGEVNAYETGF